MFLVRFTFILAAILLPAILTNAAPTPTPATSYHVDSTNLCPYFCHVFQYLCKKQSIFDGYPASVNTCSAKSNGDFSLQCKEDLGNHDTSDITEYVFEQVKSIPNFAPGPIKGLQLHNYVGQGYCQRFQNYCSGLCGSLQTSVDCHVTGTAADSTVDNASCVCGGMDYTGFISQRIIDESNSYN